MYFLSLLGGKKKVDVFDLWGYFGSKCNRKVTWGKKMGKKPQFYDRACEYMNKKVARKSKEYVVPTTFLMIIIAQQTNRHLKPNYLYSSNLSSTNQPPPQTKLSIQF